MNNKKNIWKMTKILDQKFKVKIILLIILILSSINISSAMFSELSTFGQTIDETSQ